jgi:hypothetical protein
MTWFLEGTQNEHFQANVGKTLVRYPSHFGITCRIIKVYHFSTWWRRGHDVPVVDAKKDEALIRNWCGFGPLISLSLLSRGLSLGGWWCTIHASANNNNLYTRGEQTPNQRSSQQHLIHLCHIACCVIRLSWIYLPYLLRKKSDWMHCVWLLPVVTVKRQRSFIACVMCVRNLTGMVNNSLYKVPRRTAVFALGYSEQCSCSPAYGRDLDLVFRTIFFGNCIDLRAPWNCPKSELSRP